MVNLIVMLTFSVFEQNTSFLIELIQKIDTVCQR